MLMETYTLMLCCWYSNSQTSGRESSETHKTGTFCITKTHWGEKKKKALQISKEKRDCTKNWA